MSAKFVKGACAIALATPLLLMGQVPAHAEVGPAESDCGDGTASGAVTKTPHQGDACYGIDDAFFPNKPKK